MNSSIENTCPGPKKSWNRALLQGLPIFMWMLLLILVPLAIMFVTSFFVKEGVQVVHRLTLRNYLEFFTNPIYLPIFFRTIFLALSVSLTALLLAYPLAFFISRKVTRFRSQLYMMVIVPLWISYLVRIVAWRTILGRVGVLNSLLLALGLIREPLPFLIYSPFAVYLTLIHIALPFVFISVFSSLEKIPSNLLDATSDLGANSFQTFRHVILPLSMPGVVSGFTLAFVIALGDYIIPQQLGGLNGLMFGNLIVSQFGYAFNWPLGAALGFIMFAVAVAILFFSQKLGSSEGFLE
ncbi:MAG: ABC transporter permease [Candidatus Atribacteria bacterium]|nr:ABC transporter permease [Candidatus Atribacteria bacterium]